MDREALDQQAHAQEPGPGPDLRDALAERDRQLERSRVHLRQIAASQQEQGAELKRVRRELQTLRRRRSVRVALAIAGSVRPLASIARRLVALGPRAMRSIRARIREWRLQRSMRVSRAAESVLAAALRAARAPATATSGPLVSIVIVSRDGLAGLTRCLASVAASTYRDIEVIVVDDGSTDGSPAFAEQNALPFPLTVIRNADDRTFSDGNERGAAKATGALLCFLDTNVEAITPDWLGYLVETISSTDAAAVGAQLIHARHPHGRRSRRRHADLTVKHAGVRFDRADPIPMPRAIGAGGDPLAHPGGVIEERPALSGACLLVRRDRYDAVGGFTPGYEDGLGDADLCLKLQAAAGRLMYDGRAVLWEHESAARVADQAGLLARHSSDRERFVALWGPRLFREGLLDGLAGRERLSGQPFHVAITAGSDDPAAGVGDRSASHELGDAMEQLGWRVSYVERGRDGWSQPPASAEAVIVLVDDWDVRRSPRRLVTIGWIADSPDRWLDRPWFDEFDLVLGSSQAIVDRVHARSAKVATLLSPVAEETDPTRAAMVRDALVAWASATRYSLRAGVPNWDVAQNWGDYHYARALQRSLERDGHPTRVHLLFDWFQPVTAREDVTVHLFGIKEAPSRVGQTNLLWQISHPDLATAELYDRYDHAFVASDPFAALMAARCAVPVTALHQATDPERFQPDPTGPHHELLFVANSRGVRRRIVDDLAGTSHDLAIYGKSWTAAFVDLRLVKGIHIPNDEVGRYYSSAAIVLNDHWDDMRAEGFFSNRLYDALACGAFVISDHVDGIEAEFDGAVVTYRDRQDLDELVTRYLADPAERQRLGERGRTVILARHTFAIRARVIQDIASGIALTRPGRIFDDVR